MQQATPRRLQVVGTIKLSDSDRSALDLVVASAADGELADVALRFGRLRATPAEQALVVSPITGRIPRPPAILLGAAVVAGAALIEVVPTLAAAERISVNVQDTTLAAQIEGTQHELATQEAASVRARELAKSNIISQAQLQQAETAVATARARLEGLRRARQVQTTGEGSPLTLRSPVAGTVVTLNASVGAVVQQGDLLVQILKPGPRWIDVSVAPGEPTGERYEIAAGTKWLPARLIASGAVIDDDGTRHDRLQLDGGGEGANLLPGEIVSVRVARGAARGVVLPESAIVPGVEHDLVFVETAAGTFTARPVRLAARFGGHVRLASGVQPGEKVVTRGAMALLGESRRSELRHLE